MIVRTYKLDDEPAVKALCPHSDIDPARDAIAVVELENKIVAAFAFRPIAFAHSFSVELDATKRLAAEAVLAYALGAARAMGHREALFTVDRDNDAMRKFIESKGAKEQSGVVYTMEVK
jgi:hypothetical protein